MQFSFDFQNSVDTCVRAGKAGVLRFSVGHGGGGVRRPDRRRLHADRGRKQPEHPRLRHGPAARQPLQRPLLSKVRLLISAALIAVSLSSDAARIRCAVDVFLVSVLPTQPKRVC